MREIVLDTETTGLDVNNGDRIVEIGVVELENHVQTGAYFHYYFCLLYTSPSPRDGLLSRMPSSA